MNRISKIFVVAGLVNIVGALAVSAGFTSGYAECAVPYGFKQIANSGVA